MAKLCCFLLALSIFGSSVSGVPFTNNLESNDIPSETDFVNSIDKCVQKLDTTEIASCATERIVRSLDKLSSKENLEILPGVSLLSDGNQNFRSGKVLNEEIEDAKANGDSSMLELIGNATARLFAGRTLKVKLPDSETIGRALEEGRKRMGGGKNKNKGNTMLKGLMGFGGIMAAMIPIFMGKVALIAAKALIVGKIALVIGAILLFQTFFRRGGNSLSDNSWFSSSSHAAPVSSYGTPTGSYGVPSSQYPYSRSFKDFSENAQNLAYSAQK